MSTLRRGPVAVRVPASSANLGPGFDALGLALTLHDVVHAEVLDSGGPRILVEGEGAGAVPLDATHLVHRSMVHGFAALGLPVPAVRLRCVNAVPHGRGLGSSSAAIVAGLAIARELVDDGPERWDDAALLAVAAEIEGHPDNVAPAVLGGFTVAYAAATGGARAARVAIDEALAFVAFVPAEPLATSVARGLLPESVPHADAARNAGRAALLVAALTGRPEHLLAATEDRLHQDYRAPAMPRSAALVAALRADGVAAVVSGAGPTVLAILPTSRSEDVAAVTARTPEGWRVLVLDVDVDGVRAVPTGGAEQE